MTLLAPIKPWTCTECGQENTTVRCRGPRHEGAREWAAHVARVKARESTLPTSTAFSDGNQVSTCTGCGEERWIPPASIHCVECLALARRPDNHERRWSPGEEVILEEDFGRVPNPEIAERLFRAGFQPRTAQSVKVHGQRRLGPARKAQPHLWTVRQLVQELQVSRDIVQEARLAGIITPVSSAGTLLFEQDAYDTLAKLHPPPPTRSIPATEAASRLGYNRHHVDRLLREGALRGVMRGKVWYVDEDHVEQIAAKLRESGEARIRWGIGVTGRYALAVQTERRKQREARRAGKVTAKLAAERLGLCHKTIGELIAAGLLDAEKEHSTRWLIDADQIEVLELHPALLQGSIEATRGLA